MQIKFLKPMWWRIGLWVHPALKPPLLTCPNDRAPKLLSTQPICSCVPQKGDSVHGRVNQPLSEMPRVPQWRGRRQLRGNAQWTGGSLVNINCTQRRLSRGYEEGTLLSERVVLGILIEATDSDPAFYRSLQGIRRAYIAACKGWTQLEHTGS